VRFDADVGGALHQLELVAGLEQPHLVEQVAQLEEFVRRLRAHADLGTHAVQPADELEIELRVATEVVVHARAAFEQPGQDLVQVGNGVRIVHAEGLDCALLAGARTVPGFAVGIALAAEQQGLAMRAAGDEDEDGLGFGEAGEVPEVRILPVRVMRIAAADAFGGGRQYEDGVVAGHPHQLLAAPRVRRHRQRQGPRELRGRRHLS